MSCKHGLDILQCANCHKNLHYVNVSTDSRRSVRFGKLDESTRYVHIGGRMHLWAFERVLENAPNVCAIQITPKSARRLGQRHRELCREKGVQIITGYAKKNSKGWNKKGDKRAIYKKERRFLLNLNGEQKERFDELLAMEAPEARMAVLFYRLNGEKKFATQPEIAKQFGLRTATSVCMKLKGLLHYLDPTIKVNRLSQGTARNLARRVEVFRKKKGESSETYNSKDFPRGLPPSGRCLYRALKQKADEGKLGGLYAQDRKAWLVVRERFGLADGQYKTLRVVAQKIQLSHERVRQLEERALKALDLKE